MIVDVRIPHLAGRANRIKEISARLDHPSFELTVLTDEPTPEHLGSIERRTKTAAALTRAWAPPYHGDHVLVLEDDAVLALDADQAILAVLRRFPSSPIGFFCFREYTIRADEAGATYARHGCFSGGVAQCLPADMARDFDAWHRAEFASRRDRSVDGRLSHYVQRHGIPVIFPAPSIVNHDQGIASTYAFGGREAKPVRAAYAFTSAASAMIVDWARGRVWDSAKGICHDPL